VQTDVSNGIIRVVVARAGAKSPIPSALETVPTFDVPDSAADLSSYIINGNTIADDIAREVQAQQESQYGPKLGVQPYRRMDTRLLEFASMLRGYYDRNEFPLSPEDLEEMIKIGESYVDVADGG
jgi:hypothetical protein